MTRATALAVTIVSLLLGALPAIAMGTQYIAPELPTATVSITFSREALPAVLTRLEEFAEQHAFAIRIGRSGPKPCADSDVEGRRQSDWRR